MYLVAFIAFLLKVASASVGWDCLSSSEVMKISSWPTDCDGGTCQASNRQPSVVKSTWDRFRESNCFCDDRCRVYSDCCQDKKPGASAHELVLPRDTFSCLVVEGLYSTGLPIYVVNGCPKDWADDVIREKCEQEAGNGSGLFLNWFVSDENLILFRNFYCALCHDRTNVIYWKMRVACDSVIDFTGAALNEHHVRRLIKKLEQGVCHLKYEPPERVNRARFVRLCKPMADSCPEHWTNDCVRELCQGTESQVSFVYSGRKLRTYRNKYCAFCNHADNVTCDDVVTGWLFEPVAGVMRDTSFYPLNIIFDLNPGGHAIAEYKIGTESGTILNRTVHRLTSCPEQHVYDPFVRVCRFVTCRPGYVYKNGRCEGIVHSNGTTDDDCRMIKLNQSEYFLLDNGSIFLNDSNLIFDEDEYELLANGSLAVCTEFKRNYTESEQREPIMKFSKAQGIISVIGQIISIFALATTIVIYACLPKLQNLAGKCIICLSASLLTAQLFFLIGVSFHVFDNEDTLLVCLVFAIVTHIAFLCSFVWMNVMAFDICRIFSGSVHKTSTEGLKRRFRKYSVYGWITPIAIVFIAAAVDFGSSSDSSFRPGYGQGICWITNRKALFLFFALPVALILAANVIMFVLTAVHITKVQRDTKRATGNTDRRRYGVYIKISVVMGLTWIFAFLAAGTDSEVLWYFFLVFNTLQGAFIFVSFIFTKQVLGMAREQYRKLQRTAWRRTDRSTEERTLTTTTSHLSTHSSNLTVQK